MIMGCSLSNHIFIKASLDDTDIYSVEKKLILPYEKDNKIAKTVENNNVKKTELNSNVLVESEVGIMKGDLNQRREAKQRRQRKMKKRRKTISVEAEVMSDKVMDEKERLSYFSSIQSRSTSRATTPIDLVIGAKKRSAIVSPGSLSSFGSIQKRSVTFSEGTKWETSSTNTSTSPTSTSNVNNLNKHMVLRRRSSDQNFGKYSMISNLHNCDDNLVDNLANFQIKETSIQ